MTHPKTGARGVARHGDYRYERFTMKLLLQDLKFQPDALAPGDPMPPVELDNLDGGTLRVGGEQPRPMLLITGSITCPMTATAMPVLQELHDRFGDRVDFVLLATREAHPGGHFPQPHTQDAKIERAQSLREHYDVPYAIAVDHIEGELHQLLDGKPNTAYVVDRDGTIVFRSHWARDEESLGAALTSVVKGETPSKQKSAAMLGPVTRAMGSVDHVIGRAGPGAHADLWRSAFPMAMAGKVARLFRFRHVDHRGIAAAVTLGVTMAIGVAVVLLVIL